MLRLVDAGIVTILMSVFSLEVPKEVHILYALYVFCALYAQAPSQLFNRASANAKKYFREGRFSEAAEQYGIALSHCDNLENRRSQRTALHNNRCQRSQHPTLSVAPCPVNEQAHFCDCDIVFCGVSLPANKSMPGI